MTAVEAAAIAVKNALFVEIQNGNYGFLKYLCKKFKKNITADEVFAVDKIYYSTPDVQLYYDLYKLLCEDMESRMDEYFSAYVDYYRSIFSRQYDEIQSLDLSKIDISSYTKKIVYNSVGEHNIRELFQMVLFMLKAKDDLEANYIIEDIIPTEYGCFADRIPDKEFIKNVIEHIPLREGKLALYIEHCRKNLAKNMGIEERQLNDVFRKKILADINLIEPNFSKDQTYAAIQTLVANNNGSTLLYDVSLIKEKENNLKQLYYFPDIDKIIESYYESKIAAIPASIRIWRINKNISEDTSMNTVMHIKLNEMKNSGIAERIELAKLIENRNPRLWASLFTSPGDEEEILKLVYVDVVYHLFDYTLKNLYEEKLKDFLYDAPVIQQKTDQKKIDTLRQQVENLEKINKNLRDESQTFKTKYLKLKAQVDEWKREEEEFIRQTEEEIKRERELDPDIFEKSEMLFEMEQQDKQRYETKMGELERKLKERDDLIDQLLAEEDTCEENKIPLENLHLYKYLFVGDLSISGFQDLKHKFYNSIFFEKESADLKSVSADFIVLMTTSMSHALFYKLDSYKNLRFIPRIYYNKKTLSGLLDAMAAQIYKIENSQPEETDSIPEWEPL